MIRTILGDVEPAAIGPTMMHEHVFIDLRRWHEPGGAVDTRSSPIGSENIAAVNAAPLAFEDNLLLADPDTAIKELSGYRSSGGSCLVDMTCEGLGGRPERLRDVSRLTGVHIVLGCGFFVHEFHPSWVCPATVEALTEYLENQLRSGILGSQVLPGVIGEVGMSNPPRRCETRVLRAAARASISAGVSLHIHIDPHGAEAARFVAIAADEGLPAHRIVCGHLDVRLDRDYHIEVLSTGANVGFDTFGTDVFFSGLLVRPDDAARLRLIAELIDSGFEDQLVVAQDVAFKCHLKRYGGNGYDHILTRVAPAMVDTYGVPEEVLEKLIIHNPRRILSLAA